MALTMMTRLEEQLKCSICLDTFTDPKLLQCSHVFCQKCLVPLVVEDQQKKLSITCPTCRRITPVPDSGAKDLPPAFHINRLLDIHHSASKEVGCCTTHADQELRLYCMTCKKLICLECAIRGGGHNNHRYRDLDHAFGKCKQKIMSAVEPLKGQATVLRNALADLDNHCATISDQRENIENDLHATFRQLRDILDVRETELTRQLHQITQGKLKALAGQRNNIETTLTVLDSYLQFVGESLEKGNKGYVLMTKADTLKEITTRATQLKASILKPITAADMSFTRSEKLTPQCLQFGEISAVCSPDPLKCSATGKALKSATVGEKLTFSLTINKSRKDPLYTIQCELTSVLAENKIYCGAQRRLNQNEYEIVYQPTIKGRHQLDVLVEGQPIKGSPFTVAVKSSLTKLGPRIFSIERMIGPVGVAISREGEVFVSEVGRGQILVFSSDGHLRRHFSQLGNEEGELKSPHGIAVDGDGNILVTDTGNHRIQKFTATGQCLASASIDSECLQFTGIAFNTSNRKVYVVDSDRNVVEVFNFNLTYYHTFGKIGTGKGEFREPCGVACDSTGKVYVADSGNHRIQVFTAEGKFLTMFGKHGGSRGELNRPYYIAIDSSDMIYISEWGSHRISVFTSEGQFVVSFGRRGERPGEFEYPCGLAVDDCGVVYVCDGENNRVQVF